MKKSGSLWFGLAREQADFEQIFRLNHRTFVEEIPQHVARSDGRLVDKFHAENDYIICKRGGAIIGMVALRCSRPFSLDAKVLDLDRFLPQGRRLCEFRLLSVDPAHRGGMVLGGLFRQLAERCREKGCDYAVISGTMRQLGLYRRLGFEPFGPLVGSAGAQYQPMGVSLERLSERVGWLIEPTCLTPGPVQVHPDVLAALSQRPLSHRSAEVAALLGRCRQRLITLTGADEVQVMAGSGTLANDVIAQQLRLLGGRGLILSNGEFGERLVDHAGRAGLIAEIHRVAWGRAFDFSAIAAEVAAGAPPAWIWMAHCETSTAVLNDLARFKELASCVGAQAVLDCVSAIGNVPVDLQGVAFASATSGKGLASIAGLAFVFHAEGGLATDAAVPRYLDLTLYEGAGGIAFTQSSNLLAAMEAALDRTEAQDMERRRSISAAVRVALAQQGIEIVDDDEAAAPFIVTVALPRSVSSRRIGERLRVQGYHIAYESSYLVDRNWVQLAWMGAVSAPDVLGAVKALSQALPRPPLSAPPALIALRLLPRRRERM
jgi:aspartate aminotransferase-like enzyme/predicted N-acetyltransferase YhbS